MFDDNDGFKDDYLWDVEHGYYDEAEELISEEQEDEDDEIVLDLDGIEAAELEDAGIDIDEFEMMDDDEKRQALIDAGLEPDDYNLW